MEARKGFSRERARAKTAVQVEEIRGYEADFVNVMEAYADRILAIDRSVAERWGEMLGHKETNVMDAAIAATAMVHSLVVATRNVRHFRGRGVRLVDPFRANPDIMGP